MCSYIGFVKTVKEVTNINKHVLHMFQNVLNEKGQGNIKAVIKINNFNKEYNDYQISNIFNAISQDLTKGGYEYNTLIDFVCFNRLEPEMEDNHLLIQPYINRDTGAITAVHGTIPNAENIKNIIVDTDIFYTDLLNENIYDVEQSGGKVSVISILNNKIKTYHNGLGCYDNMYMGITFISNVNILNATNSFKMDSDDLKSSWSRPRTGLEKENGRVRYIALFSGGLDITCSVYKEVMDNPNIKGLDLWYFDWGTNAAKYEIKAGKDFMRLLIDDGFIENSRVSHEVINIKKMFKNILKVCDTTVRLNDSDAKGKGKEEAEAAISYVPFRNQFLLTLAAARAEQLYPNEKVKFIIGGNLSEGMIMNDNNQTFLEHINNLIKVGGQNTFNFEVVAPFVNKTKTEMIKSFLVNGESDEFEVNFDTVFSCYFPKEDGSVCNECGSCLLKEVAFKKAQGEYID